MNKAKLIKYTKIVTKIFVRSIHRTVMIFKPITMHTCHTSRESRFTMIIILNSIPRWKMNATTLERLQK